MNRDLVVFGEDWGQHPSSTQHLIKRLAEDRKIIWVNSIGLRRPKFSVADISRVINKLKKMMGNMVAHSTPQPQNMTFIEPRVIPVPTSRWAINLNRLIIGKTLRKVMKKENIKNPIFWTSLPTAAELTGLCEESAIVYYCGDDFGALAGVDHQPVLNCEMKLAKKADLIFTASDVLANNFDPGKTKHLPHGVDTDLFTRPSIKAHDLPDHGPVAGFYGSISEWIDQDLIIQCATSLPDWTFVFVGSQHVDVSKLQSMPNIHLLGARSHEQLPSYVQHWDVSIMPFVDNAQIRACNPLKLREYMAAGRPIVATPFPALEPYKNYIIQANTQAGYVRGLKDAFKEGLTGQAPRQQAVNTESWSARADDVNIMLNTL